MSLNGFEALLHRCAFALQDELKVPLDIEFIVTRREQLVVTQVRPMSAAHVRNWQTVGLETWAALDRRPPPANVVNTVGARSGTVVDLRSRASAAEDFEDVPAKIFVVRHDPAPGATSSFDLLRAAHQFDLSGLKVIVHHPGGRHDNHLQYVMFEDPGVEFCVGVSDCPAELPPHLTVRSDGFGVEFE
jgi:hypothetical protein